MTGRGLAIPSPSPEQGFYGGGYTQEFGSTNLVQQEIPVAPPLSIAALSHARLGGFSLANQALGDDFFFSSITPQPSSVKAFGNSSRTAKEVAGDFFFNAKPLPNRRIIPYPRNRDPTGLDELFTKPRFKEYGSTKAPASPQQMLLLVRKGKDNAAGFDVIALDGQVNAFGGGKFLFMNAAKVDIAGVVGEVKFVVKPGQHSIIKPELPAGQEVATASFYFRKDNASRAFFSSRWPLGDHARALIFFYHDPENLRIRMHTIRDFM